jgi:hypothetical protein
MATALPAIHASARAMVRAASPECSDAVALRAFVRLVNKWGLTEAQARGLLGRIASSTYHKWKTNPEATRPGPDVLMRISLLLGIYLGLHGSFSRALADKWPTLGNRATLFAGGTPLSYMLEHGQPGMVRVRSMVDSWSAS